MVAAGRVEAAAMSLPHGPERPKNQINVLIEQRVDIVL